MSKKHLLTSFLALVITAIASLSTSITAPVAAQQQSCFNGQGSLNSNLPYKTNVTFDGKPLLIILEEYDSGKTANVYGAYHSRRDAQDGNNGYIYSYTPVVRSCKAAIESAVKQKYPNHKVVVQ